MRTGLLLLPRLLLNAGVAGAAPALATAASRAHFAVRQKQGLLLHMMAAPPMRKMALATCTHHSKAQQHFAASAACTAAATGRSRLCCKACIGQVLLPTCSCEALAPEHFCLFRQLLSFFPQFACCAWGALPSCCLGSLLPGWAGLQSSLTM